MRKGTLAIIIAGAAVAILGVTAAVAGPSIYREFLVAPAPVAPTLSADDSALNGESNTEITAADLDGTWVVVEGSEAGYRVDEILNGEPVTVVGSTSNVTGTLEFANLTLESATFEVDVASIATDNGQRDRYFRDQALNVSANPTATFTLAEPVTAAQPPVAGEVIEQPLSGDLTLAGVTQRVTFTAQLRTDGTTTEVVGQIPITFADYGVAAPNLGFVAVDSTGFVEFSLLTEKS